MNIMVIQNIIKTVMKYLKFFTEWLKKNCMADLSINYFYIKFHTMFRLHTYKLLNKI